MSFKQITNFTYSLNGYPASNTGKASYILTETDGRKYKVERLITPEIIRLNRDNSKRNCCEFDQQLLTTMEWAEGARSLPPNPWGSRIPAFSTYSWYQNQSGASEATVLSKVPYDPKAEIALEQQKTRKIQDLTTQLQQNKEEIGRLKQSNAALLSQVQRLSEVTQQLLNSNQRLGQDVTRLTNILTEQTEE